MTKRRLSQAEQRIWRKVARTVTPKQTKKIEKPPEIEDFASLLNDKHHMDAPASRPIARRRPARAMSRPDQEADVSGGKTAEAADRGGDRRVRRGRIEIDASLDLHGHTQISAHQALKVFIAAQRSQNAQCVLIITGKGRAGEGVIRKRFLDWLNAPDVRGHVASYAQSHQKHGGAGAYYVFLKRRGRR